MKRIAALSALWVCLASCDSFLERTSQNLVVPTKVSQYKEMLQGGDGYFRNIQSSILWVNHMTDDVSYFDVSREVGGNNLYEAHTLQTYRFVYQWADEIEENFDDGNFSYFYSQVLAANTILDAIDAIEDDSGERELLRGQALFHRAFAYFYLANFYAQAYNEAPADAPCLPLKLTPTPSSGLFYRNTMSEVWAYIQNDLIRAIECMKRYDVPNIYELDWRAPMFLLMRVSLFMEDYSAAIRYGEELLSLNSALFDITSKEKAMSGTDSITGGSDIKNFISKENPEIIWLFGEYYRQSSMGGISDNHVYYYALSDPLIDSYDQDLHNGETDHRKMYFFIEPGQVLNIASACYNYSLLKFDSNDLDYRRMYSFRNGEIYLTLAESYARMNNPDARKAINYLNMLRRNRISSYVDLVESDFADSRELVDFVWRERRRELVGEECHRWWDLRRTGQPRIEHNWAIDDYKTNVTYVLEDHDPAYVLNFPKSERAQNPANFNERPYRTYVK